MGGLPWELRVESWEWRVQVATCLSGQAHNLAFFQTQTSHFSYGDLNRIGWVASLGKNRLRTPRLLVEFGLHQQRIFRIFRGREIFEHCQIRVRMIEFVDPSQLSGTCDWEHSIREAFLWYGSKHRTPRGSLDWQQCHTLPWRHRWPVSHVQCCTQVWLPERHFPSDLSVSVLRNESTATSNKSNFSSQDSTISLS